MGKWYILHVRTGQENRIKKLLENRINEDKKRINQIVIPEEEVLEVDKGEKKAKSRRFWPGYMLIELEDEANNEIVWHKIKTTPGVFGFLGAGETPVPLKEEEVEEIMREIDERKSKPLPKVEFKVKDRIEIIDGPFVGYTGVVEEVYPDKERLKVSVSIFGRATSLELNFWQVEKIT
ncbi:MAG: transcription termination/antitermination protein NusG [bacterium]|nr:transcription termination/antitermination protein NusG [bacterium]MDW8164620.1 transcription termination/antitermination protein NusG [Candidatus Omnitrophota bacterium]